MVLRPFENLTSLVLGPLQASVGVHPFPGWVPPRDDQQGYVTMLGGWAAFVPRGGLGFASGDTNPTFLA